MIGSGGDILFFPENAFENVISKVNAMLFILLLTWLNFNPSMDK